MAQFGGAGDYGAAMFNKDMYDTYGDNDYMTLQDIIDDKQAVVQDSMNPAGVQPLTDEIAWLGEYAESIATLEDYELFHQALTDEYDALSELYIDGDTSDENVETFNQMKALQQQRNALDPIINALKDEAYYADMADALGDLPEQLAADIMNIPYQEDAKISLIGDVTGDQAAELAAEPQRQAINAKIEETKQWLRDLGYADKDINGFVIYAGLVHDREQGQAHQAEKQAYAEEHPIAASLGSVLENFFELLDPLDTGSQKLRNLIRGEHIPLNDYSQVQQRTDGVDATRETVAGKIEEATGSELLTKLYGGTMKGADIVAQMLATGGTSSVASLGKGLVAVAKAFGDDVARALLKAFGDDAVRALATSGDDAVRALVTSGDDVGKMMLSSGDDVGKLALSSGDDVGKKLLSSGDDMIDDWYNVLTNSADDTVKSWDDVANSLDDVTDDALAGHPNTGYNGNAGAGVGNVLTAKSFKLTPTHTKTLSNTEFSSLLDDIRVNGIQEPIKYIKYNDEIYVVDGHHRLLAAKKLGITDVPIEEVTLPYKSYKTYEDLFWGN